MTTFTTDKPLTNRQFFTTIFLQIAVGISILTILYFFFERRRFESAALMFAVIVIASNVRLLLNDKLEKIVVDEKNQELHFFTKGYFSRMKHQKTGFENLVVKTEESIPKRKCFWNVKYFSIEVLKEKTLLFSVDVNEDHFSEATMKEIIATFRAYNIPVH